MVNSMKRLTMTQTLRKAIADSGSIRAISLATGVTRQSMMKFARGEQSLRLDMADLLAEHFGLALLPAKPTKQTRKGNK